jgi:ubiquinone/menaquinone biosynthesis C-methylase UbiE
LAAPGQAFWFHEESKRFRKVIQSARNLRDKHTFPYSDPQMAKYYANFSAKYQFTQPAKDLAALLNISSGQHILDIGSGSGLIATAASEIVGSSGLVFALDASIEMLKQQKMNRVNRVVADAEQLPFAEGVFERIAAGFVISHLSDYSKGLENWVRVLRPGGVLAASAWEITAIKVAEMWKAMIKQYLDLNQVEEAAARIIPSDQFFSLRDNLTKVFKDAGLMNAKAETKTYLISMNVDQYIDSKIGSVEGTIIRNHLDQERWREFLAKLREDLLTEFPQRVEFSRNVHFVSGEKPI